MVPARNVSDISAAQGLPCFGQAKTFSPMTRPAFLGVLTPLMVALVLWLWPESTKTAALTASDVAAFEWFSSLGFSPERGLQPVEVWTGGESESSRLPDKRRPTTKFGFLLRSEGQVFTVSSLFLRHRTYVASPDPKQSGGVHYRNRTLDEIADALLYTDNKTIIDLVGEVSGRPELTLGYFFVAWHFWHEGRPDLAARTLASLRWLPRAWQGRPHQDLKAKFADSVSAVIFEGIVLAFNDPKVSHKELLFRLQKFLRVLPTAPDANRARWMARGTEALMAEELIHPLLAFDLVATLPPAEKAKELVRHLRNHCYPSSSPNPSVEHLLRQMGEAAVPALIAAVDDARPTRALNFRFKGYTPESIQSIGSVANSLLWSITGKQFGALYHPSLRFDEAPPAHTSQRRREIETWWAEYLRKGTRQYLLDEVATPNIDFVSMANRLTKEFPTEAGGAIEATYPRLAADMKVYLINNLHRFANPRWLALLRKEAESAESSSIREAATRLLKDMEPTTPPPH